MTAGILVALLAGFYAFYQLSYDKFIKDHDRIFRIEYTQIQQGNIWPSASCSPSLAMLMKDEIPGIEDVITNQKMPLNLGLKCDEKPFGLSEFSWVSPNFVEYYELDFIYGTKGPALQTTGNMLITESISEKYFPNQNPMGKKLKIQHNDIAMFEIAGVIKDLPVNSHIKTQFISLDPLSSDEEQDDIYDPENLIFYFDQVYLVLDKHTSIDKILNYFPEIKQKYMASTLEEKGYDLELTATNISKMHFRQNLWNDYPSENINSIYYFLLVAVVVILISIINFINLSLARHAGRNIDIGIRKTIGATKTQIFWQYLLESYLFILISFILALLVFYFLLPSFADFNGLELTGTRISTTGFLWLIPILLLVGFLAGFYPALVTSGKYPQFILRNHGLFKSKKGNRIFVIIQLVLSIIFIIGTLVIFLQLQYTNRKDKGYNLENVIVYEYPSWGPQAFKKEDICEMLKNSAYIRDIAVGSILPGQDIYPVSINIEFPDEIVKVKTAMMYIDHNYLPSAGIDILFGRNFQEELASDSAKVLVNSTFARKFDSIEDAIGSRVYFDKVNEDDYEFDAEIIGVVSDFHFQSMHHKIIPMVISARNWPENYYYIKYQPNNLKFVLEDAQKVFDELAKKNIHAAIKHFPEEELKKRYETERHLSQMTIWLAVLTIILAILGVFGLTAFLVRNNMKMLCLRKVFGAETKSLFKLLLQDYSVVLLIANIIALPLAWYVCTKWLERFAYHISLSIWLFLTGMIMSVLIVIIAILYHVWIISKIDPVVFLQDE
jgi:putative ABC transport system permease protein